MILQKKLSRFIFVISILALFLFVIIIRYFYLMVILPKKSKTFQDSDITVERGPILDRNGKILAIQTRLNSVTAWIPDIEQPEETAVLLGKILNLEDKEIYNRLKNNTGFLYIKRRISSSESKEINELLAKGKLKGIYLKPEFGRNYPEKNNLSHIIGIVGVDNNGLDGIEFTYDEELLPHPKNKNESYIYGNQIYLTIDLNIQHYIYNIAQEAYDSTQAQSVIVLLMDAKKGEFLSWVSIPSYDPNDLSTYTSDSKLNRPIVTSYEPGSVFKVFSLSSLLELGGISKETYFNCQGYYEKTLNDEKTIRINCLGVHGEVNPLKIIKYSCNSGAAYSSEMIDSESFFQMLRLFGFGQSTMLPLPGEGIGLLRDPSQWSSRSKPTIAMGQEISVTAVQMVQAATALANNGILLRPHLIKKIISPEGKLKQSYSREPVRKVLTEETVKDILSMMKAATGEDGTAKRVYIEGINIAAKTGTAQVLDVKTGKYSEKTYIASCLAIVPEQDPNIILYVVIEAPKSGSHFGGQIAAPLVKDIIQAVYNKLDLSKDTDITAYHSNIIKIPEYKELKIGSSIPKLIGLSKKQLLPLLKDPNLKVRIKGEGWVVRQNPPPGTEITKDMLLEIELR